MARLDGKPLMVIGHEKGRKTKRKSNAILACQILRIIAKLCVLMKMAERFKLPIITFIDTPGAYPGIGAEERNQSEAIARNLFVLSRLKTPIICTVIGEGGSGGALGNWCG